MFNTQRYIKVILWLMTAAFSGLVLLGAGIYLYLSPKLPPVEALRDIQLQTPLRVYSQDGQLIGEFGEKRRIPIAIEDTPPAYIQALLAAEDSRFYEHGGVDVKGLLRAVAQLLTTGHIQTGGSTITMQVARNFFLSRKKTFVRKFNEILLSLEIEKELSKDEILELYVNKIYQGNRAYGIQAAAQIYYGKPIQELSHAQLAMIAGLPKAPSAYNPIANPERALVRRNWILGRMHELGHLSDEDYELAINEAISASLNSSNVDIDAPYVAEIARREALERYGEAAYTDGLRVYTTVDSRLQARAQQAVQEGAIAYTLRHGFTGPEASLAASDDEALTTWREALDNTRVIANLYPAVVILSNDTELRVLHKDGSQETLDWEQVKDDLRPHLDENRLGPTPKQPQDSLQAGDLIRLYRNSEGWRISQLPAVQAALISLKPDNGAIQALVGGFDFNLSKYNRVFQAQRQPGSNFKPFVYTAALESGFTAASMINDAPVVLSDQQLESTWRPENASGQFFGPTPLRRALYLSRNMVSIRLLRSMGVSTVVKKMERFGFDPETLPHDLTLALGSHAVTPLQIATAYAALANGGYRVESFLVDRIEDQDGNLLFKQRPLTVCRDCPEDEDSPLAETAGDDSAAPNTTLAATDPPVADEVAAAATEDQALTPLDPDADLPPPRAEAIADPRVIYIVNSMLKDVIKRGTGHRAMKLQRNDLAGKTGTTNGPKDAWFSGYNPQLVTTTWLGFDQNLNLGRREYGGSAALPIWIDYMGEALKDVPEQELPQPDGLVMVRIDPTTGKPARPGQENATFEIFRSEFQPEEEPEDISLSQEELAPGDLF